MSRLPPVLAATGPFFMFSLEETFELIADAGFDGAELMVTQDRLSQDPYRLGALAGRYGLSVPAIHGPFLVATWLVWGTDPKGKIERCVRFAEAAKVPTVVIHPPYRWQNGYADWLPEAVARVRAETGVTIAVENMFPVAAGGRSPGGRPRRPGAGGPPPGCRGAPRAGRPGRRPRAGCPAPG